MNYKDLRHFSKFEIEATGATADDVQPKTLYAIDYVREKLKRAIRILKNGLTTGNHGSLMHPEGLAVDFTIDGEITNALLYSLVRHAIDAGFRGIGFYMNKKGKWSFHLDMREKLTIWVGRKNKANEWNYDQMLFGHPSFLQK